MEGDGLVAAAQAALRIVLDFKLSLPFLPGFTITIQVLQTSP